MTTIGQQLCTMDGITRKEQEATSQNLSSIDVAQAMRRPRHWTIEDKQRTAFLDSAMCNQKETREAIFSREMTTKGQQLCTVDFITRKEREATSQNLSSIDVAQAMRRPRHWTIEDKQRTAFLDSAMCNQKETREAIFSREMTTKGQQLCTVDFITRKEREATSQNLSSIDVAQAMRRPRHWTIEDKQRTAFLDSAMCNQKETREAIFSREMTTKGQQLCTVDFITRKEREATSQNLSSIDVAQAMRRPRHWTIEATSQNLSSIDVAQAMRRPRHWTIEDKQRTAFLDSAMCNQKETREAIFSREMTTKGQQLCTVDFITRKEREATSQNLSSIDVAQAMRRPRHWTIEDKQRTAFLDSAMCNQKETREAIFSREMTTKGQQLCTVDFITRKEREDKQRTAFLDSAMCNQKETREAIFSREMTTKGQQLCTVDFITRKEREDKQRTAFLDSAMCNQKETREAIFSREMTTKGSNSDSGFYNQKGTRGYFSELISTSAKKTQKYDDREAIVSLDRTSKGQHFFDSAMCNQKETREAIFSREMTTKGQQLCTVDFITRKEREATSQNLSSIDVAQAMRRPRHWTIEDKQRTAFLDSAMCNRKKREATSQNLSSIDVAQAMRRPRHWTIEATSQNLSSIDVAQAMRRPRHWTIEDKQRTAFLDSAMCNQKDREATSQNLSSIDVAQAMRRPRHWTIEATSQNLLQFDVAQAMRRPRHWTIEATSQNLSSIDVAQAMSKTQTLTIEVLLRISLQLMSHKDEKTQTLDNRELMPHEAKKTQKYDDRGTSPQNLSSELSHTAIEAT
ncbi:hypothetical protein C0Q70_05401 [Pomacea canaliculata]|uniref:Uncharacterized protein n=1 Tax=Pomacea canaliculata TaxID=400727 RepID=A0A2T7PL43_POMCA|nr:hypothetical protein C0Q70_05401 [Pomacea canaliculata]